VFHTGAYYAKSQVTVHGRHNEHCRPADSGYSVRFHFCPNCGSNVFWEPSRFPDHFVVAVGAFADPLFPAPALSLWEVSKHSWVELPALQHCPEGLTASAADTVRADPPSPTVDRAQIAQIGCVIRPFIRRTPTLEIDGADCGLPPGLRIVLKLEQLQHSGSFKARGAFANLLLRRVPEIGVAAASGGNHGAAVAYAAMRRQVPARIFVPEISSPAKIARIQEYGADLVVGGERYADALAACESWIAETGALSVHAFDQRETLLGQGTLAQELEAQAPELDTVLAGVGGGGLISGIAAWYGGRVKVIGVEPEGSPTLYDALAAGHPVDAETTGIAADSLAPRRVGELVFPIAQARVDQVVLVTDDAIRRAQQVLWNTARIVAEPGGSAAFAALLSGRYTPCSRGRVGVVISGGNTVAVDFGR